MQIIKKLTVTEKRGLKNEFAIYTNAEIEKINLLIGEYNKYTAKSKKKLAILYQINQLRQALDDHYSQDLLIKEFQIEIQDKLFTACKQQFAEYNISMHEHALARNHPEHPNNNLPEQNNPFSDMLANMSADDVRKMLVILSKGSGFDENRFFNVFKESNPKYHEIINGYKIESMPGSNSKNFKLTPRDLNNPHSFVLRVDNRLGGAREMDTYMRTTSLASVLTPIEAARSVTYEVGDKQYTNALLVTSFCKNGTPMTHSDESLTANHRIQGALDIYSQMGKILSDIEKEGLLFPDAKNSNWLLDANNKLVIADTKSLLYSQEGMYDADKAYLKNRWIYGTIPLIISTSEFSPPEIHNRQFSVDKMHSYTMGLNLYQYLTQCTNKQLLNKPLQFNYPIFNDTPEGQQLKILILKMTQDRISVSKTLDELELIKNLNKPTSVSTKDKEKNPEMISFVQNVVTQLRLKAIYEPNASKKADAIVSAFNKIPTEQLSDIMTTKNPSPEVKKFRAALGTYRTVFGNITIPESLSSWSPLFYKYQQKFQEFTNKKQVNEDKQLETDNNPKRP